jgi:hypothetical protein
MKWSFVILVLTCVACSDTRDGARSQCAAGGAIQGTCPLEDRTVEGACWRYVDCGAMLLQSMNHFDWQGCVGAIEGVPPQTQTLIINCVAGATCDGLKVQGSPDDPDPNMMYCLVLGGVHL